MLAKHILLGLFCLTAFALPSPSLAAEQAVNTDAYQSFQDAQKVLANKLFQSDYAKSSPLALANTQDYFFTLVESALENADRKTLADTPILAPTVRYLAKPGLFNPDNRYLLVFIQPEKSYAIDIRRGTETQFLLQFMKSYSLEALGPVGALVDLSDCKPGENKTIYIGGPKRDKDWYPADPDIKFVNIRQTFADWKATPSEVIVRALNDDVPVERPQTSRLALAADSLTKMTALWVDKLTNYHAAPVNAVEVPNLSGAGGLKGQNSILFQFDLKPDEALIVTSKAGEAPYQGIQLGNHWFATPDWATHQVSLNPTQTHTDADGYNRFVISLTDPGVSNWLDPAGNPKGFVFLRWQGATDGITPPTVKLVKLADLSKELPSATLTLSPAERQIQISARRYHPSLR